MHITILAGAGSAAFVRAAATALADGDRLSVVVNTSGDMWAHGLKVCPDIDAILHALRPDAAPASTFAVADEIGRLGISPMWLRATDRELALQVVRTELLQAGFTLTQVTQALATRLGIDTAVLPMSDDRVEQHAVVHDDNGSRAVHIAAYLADRDQLTADQLTLVGSDDWRASSEVVDACGAADRIVLAPDSAVQVLGPILTAPDLRDAIAKSSATLIRVVAENGIGLPGEDEVEAVLATLTTTTGTIAPGDGISAVCGQDGR